MKTVLYILIVLLLVINNFYLFSQNRNQYIDLEGNVSLSTELYSSDDIALRKEHTVFRALVFPTLIIGKNIRIPLKLFYSSQKIGNQQSFNQVGISPNYKGWLTFHAGYYTSRISDLTFGDASMLGAGIEIKKKKWKTSLLYGQLKTGLEPDTSKYFYGELRRTGWAFMIGYGNRNKAFINLNIARMYENPKSITFIPAGKAPKENALGSLSFGIRMFRNKIKVKGETAISAFTNDTRIEEKEYVHAGIFKLLFTPRYSSQIDGAAIVNVDYNINKDHTLMFEGRWIGPGFVTLGYEQLQNDVLETSVSNRSNLMNRKLNVNTTIKYRVNNLRDNRFASTKRLLLSVSGNLQVDNRFGVSTQIFNYNMNSNPKNDTFRIDNIFLSFQFSPRYSFNALGGFNFSSLTYSFMGFSDNNVITSVFNKSRNHNLNYLWSISFPSSFYISTNIGYISSQAGDIKTIITSANESLGYSLLNGKLNFSFGILLSTTNGSQGGRQINCSFNSICSIGKLGQLNLNMLFNSYKYYSGSNDFKEYSAILQYIYNFKR